jgi:regulator of protease activity HflC (stomatin/prohibitin superfamily)
MYPNQEQYCPRFKRWLSTDCGLCTISAMIGTAVIMICSMVPSSYYGIEYDEYALHRDRLYNKVDYDKVYSNGYYFLGLNQEFIKFPRTYNYESFTGSTLPVFSKDGLEFGFQCDYQWKIKRDAIPDIHRNFRLAYRQQINNRVISTIKNIAITFTTEEFVTARTLVDSVITAAIANAVSSLGFDIPVDKFQFAKPILPDNIRAKSLQKVVQLINNDVQSLVQQQQLVLQETGVMVSLVLSNSTKLISQAQSSASRIISQANAAAFNIANTAEQNGLAQLFSGMEINDVTTKTLLRRVIALEENPDAQIYFGLSPSPVLSV